jgi:type I restriction enzyme S subunit
VNWSTAALGDVVEIKGGGTPSKANPDFWKGDIPWVSPKDMKRWEIAEAEDTITLDAINNSATNLIPENSILVVNRSGILKHTLPVGITRRPLAINQDLKALICSKRTDPNYIARIVKAAEPIVLRWVRATTADNFPIEKLRELEIPLPPLDEQRRIAAILDKADALRRKRKRALELVDGLTQSIFLEMFGDLLRDSPRQNRIVPLSQLADIGSGITKGRKPNGSAMRSVPYLAVVNVQDKALDLSAVKAIEATDAEIQRYRLEVNDLLLTEGGDPDKLGRGTLWSGEIAEMIHQNHVFRVRATSHEILPLYLNWLVGSSYGKAYFLRLAKQTTGIASINKTQLSEFPVIVPPLDRQKLFVERAKTVCTVAARQSSLADNIQALFSSLQHRAFAGELL